MPADHFSLTVPQSKLDPMVVFLSSALQHMGFKEMIRPIPTVCGMGEAQFAYFWLNTVDVPAESEGLFAQVLKQTHIAFSAQNAQQVKDFYAAALKAGASDNGAPGERPHYGPGYYGAFVRDPVCGVNFEVVHRGGA